MVFLWLVFLRTWKRGLIFLTKPKTVCTPSAQSFSGQCAPVAVTYIEAPVILPHVNLNFVKPQFTLHVQNLGGGLVTNIKNFADACSARGVKDVYNIVS